MNAEMPAFIQHILHFRVTVQIHLPPEQVQIPKPEKLLAFRIAIELGQMSKRRHLGKKKVILLFQEVYDRMQGHAFQFIHVFRGQREHEMTRLRRGEISFRKPLPLCAMGNFGKMLFRGLAEPVKFLLRDAFLPHIPAPSLGVRQKNADILLARSL